VDAAVGHAIGDTEGIGWSLVLKVAAAILKKLALTGLTQPSGCHTVMATRWLL
jgi:hypothetical protein